MGTTYLAAIYKCAIFRCAGFSEGFPVRRTINRYSEFVIRPPIHEETRAQHLKLLVVRSPF